MNLRTRGGKDQVWNQVQLIISSLDWLHTSQNTNKLRDATTCSHSLPSEDCQPTAFFLCLFHDDCFFSPLILFFVFSDGSLSPDGKSMMATSQNAASVKLQLEGLPLHRAALTGRSASEGKVLMWLGMWINVLLFHPEVIKLIVRLHLLIFVPSLVFTVVYICQCSQNNPVLFSLFHNATIYHDSNNNPTERLGEAAEHKSLWEHCIRSAEALCLPSNVKLCVCVHY